MAFAKIMGKKQIFFNLHGGVGGGWGVGDGSTFVYLGSSHLINDPQKKIIKKNKKPEEWIWVIVHHVYCT